ncbi:hypothetical protein Naga_100004g171 [Nannochloropsis gaditana]|uniref:Uncharacterized protein n=1 Tax=Nannochloropsis gaditana TaxID=72520 RepID=W7TXP5_9STRA|nr:hypothetical protein Naga_100004g171 [Nannochloropsis gaditana]
MFADISEAIRALAIQIASILFAILARLKPLAYYEPAFQVFVYNVKAYEARKRGKVICSHKEEDMCQEQ